MKLLQYGLKLHYRSTHRRDSGDYYEEVGDLNHYLDIAPDQYPYSQDCSLLWHGQDIGYISNTCGSITIRIGSSTFYFAPAVLKDRLLRDVLIEVVAQAKNFSKTEEMLEILKR